MTKFKKCDYCNQPDKKMHKLKSRNALFDPRTKIGDVPGGGYVKEIPIIIFLCNVCYEYFVADKGEDFDIGKIPEMSQLVDRKRKMIV